MAVQSIVVQSLALAPLSYVYRLMTSLRGLRIILLGLGVFVVAAAVSKAIQVFIAPPSTSLELSLLVPEIGIEVLFGIWLLRTTRLELGRIGAAIGFSIFTGVNLWTVWTSGKSCGCFGPMITIPPVWMASLDSCIVVLLLFHSVLQSSGAAELFRDSQRRIRTGLLLLMSFGGVIVGIGSADLRHYALSVSIRQLPPGIAFIPDEWIGTRLPLLGYIQNSKPLESGRWIIVVYHPDCWACQREVPKYVKLTRELTKSASGTRIAFVRMPPFYEDSPDLIPDKTDCWEGRLAPGYSYEFPKPLVLIVQNSVVKYWASGTAPDAR